MACPFCHSSNINAARFCAVCGKSLIVPPESLEEVVCPYCQAKNINLARFCAQCGKSLVTPLSQSRPISSPQPKKFHFRSCLGCFFKIVIVTLIVSIVGASLLNMATWRFINSRAEKLIKMYELDWLVNFEGNKKDFITLLRQKGYRVVEEEVIEENTNYPAGWDVKEKAFIVPRGTIFSDSQLSYDKYLKYLLLHEMIHAKEDDGNWDLLHTFLKEVNAYAVFFKYVPKEEYAFIVIPVYISETEHFDLKFCGLRQCAFFIYPMSVIGSTKQDLANLKILEK